MQPLFNTLTARAVLAALALSSAAAPVLFGAGEENYNPLATPRPFPVSVLQFEVADTKRDRKIPIRVYLGADRGPVVLFSHGLGGSNENNPHLGEHWAKRGYSAVFLQHHGSDELVWKKAPPGRRIKTLKEAASAENLKLRIEDVPAVLDQLKKWSQTAGHPLNGRIDLNRIGMSGHSFGAVTTQAVSGQTLTWAKSIDPRIDAAVIFSPSSPLQGSPARAFGSVKVPWLLITGTEDVSRIRKIDLESRLEVYPNLPAGDKFELVLNGADHGEVTGADKEGREYQTEVLSLTTAFWDAYLLEIPGAAAWLKGRGARSILHPKDRWQAK